MLAVNLDALGGPVATIAITGPGAHRLPWDETVCSHRRAHRHSGTAGCRAQQRPVREWCDTLGYRWQLLRQAARLATKRELGFAPPWIVARVWEPQKRGVPHLHLVVPYGTPSEIRAAECFRNHLARLVHEYDFGAVQGKLAPIHGVDAARYVASYLAGRSRKKSSIRENISDPTLPKSLLWLTPKLTRQTLVTMRTLRKARHLWAYADGRCPLPQVSSWREALTAAVVFRTIYPQRGSPVRELRPDFDVEEALSRAAAADAYERRIGVAPVCAIGAELAERSKVLTRWAFRSTAAVEAAA